VKHCTRCHEPFEPAAPFHRLCWRCWRQERDEAATAEAYHNGYNDGLRDSFSSSLRNSAGQLSTELLRDVVALTHPDRHPPERAEQATRVTAELLALREEAPAA
jgi:hypothetical protein